MARVYMSKIGYENLILTIIVMFAVLCGSASAEKPLGGAPMSSQDINLQKPLLQGMFLVYGAFERLLAWLT